LRAEQARRAQSERTEVLKTFRDATSEAYERAKEKQAELEEVIGGHNEWFEQNSLRLTALLPHVPPAVNAWEQHRNQYRSQIVQALRDRDQVTATGLWGSRLDGRRDPDVLTNEINRINAQLGRCSGLAGGLDRLFKQIEVQVLSIEKRGGGLQPPEPAPTAKPPAKAQGVKVDSTPFDPRGE
jgi:hypothetical protein